MAWEQWREAWARSGRTPADLTPNKIEEGHIIKFATRYPNAEWRALMLEQFFTTKATEVRKSPPSLGWFVSTWMDEIDKVLRDAGERPKPEAA